MPNAVKKLVVIGHPLAAEENRLAFQGWEDWKIDLIVPRIWKARSLGHVYRCPQGSQGGPGKPSIHPLSTLASGKNSLFLWMGLDGLLRDLNPDVIYCWEEPWCLSTRQAARHARNLDVSLLFYTAENRPKRLPWPFPGLMRATFSQAPACIAPTSEIAVRIEAAGFSGRAYVIPLWIRPRKQVAANPEIKCLGYIGRLIPLKRVHLLVEALASLPGWRLKIIGDGPERPNLESLASALGVRDRVDFSGHVENAMLEKHLDGVTLMILPTEENPRQAEQFGKAALEAVACGLPVLASRTGNLEILARDIPTVKARDLNTSKQMAKAVLESIRDYPTPKALADARAQVEALYGPSASAPMLRKACEEILAARTAQTATAAKAGTPL